MGVLSLTVGVSQVILRWLQAASPSRSVRAPKLRHVVPAPVPAQSDGTTATSTNEDVGDDDDDDSMTQLESSAAPLGSSPWGPRFGGSPARLAPALEPASTPQRVRRQTARAAQAAAALSEDEDDREPSRRSWLPNSDTSSPRRGLASGLLVLDAAASALEPAGRSRFVAVIQLA